MQSDSEDHDSSEDSFAFMARTERKAEKPNEDQDPPSSESDSIGPATQQEQGNTSENDDNVSEQDTENEEKRPSSRKKSNQEKNPGLTDQQRKEKEAQEKKIEEEAEKKRQAAQQKRDQEMRKAFQEAVEKEKREQAEKDAAEEKRKKEQEKAESRTQTKHHFASGVETQNRSGESTNPRSSKIRSSKISGTSETSPPEDTTDLHLQHLNLDEPKINKIVASIFDKKFGWLKNPEGSSEKNVEYIQNWIKETTKKDFHKFAKSLAELCMGKDVERLREEMCNVFFRWTAIIPGTMNHFDFAQLNPFSLQAQDSLMFQLIIYVPGTKKKRRGKKN